jgi:hypothetical protein
MGEGRVMVKFPPVTPDLIGNPINYYALQYLSLLCKEGLREIYIPVIPAQARIQDY